MFGRTALSGEAYSKYPPGYPLVLAAFLPFSKVAGMALNSTAADLMLCLPSILALIATIILLWRMCIRLGFSAAAAHITAAGFALGSFAWPYAGINFSEPFQMLCITAAAYSLITAFQEEKHWKFYLLGGGGALGYGVLTKASLGFFLPILAIGALWGWIRISRLSASSALLRTALFALPSLAVSGYLLLVNALMFGTPLDFGYKGESFNLSAFSGIHPLASRWKSLLWVVPIIVIALMGAWKLRKRRLAWILPSLGAGFFTCLFLIAVFSGSSAFAGFRELSFGWEKGLIWFVPFIVLAPVGAWKLRKHRLTWIVPTLGGSCLAYFCLMALWGGYRGGNCWGPRLLMPALPLMVLLAGAALGSIKMRIAGTCLAAAGMAINLLGVLIQYQSYYIAVTSVVQSPNWSSIDYAQIPGHLWLLRVQLAKKSWSEPEEKVTLWRNPPWIVHNSAAIPAPYTRYEQPILNPWWLRTLLKSPWQTRADYWYLRSLVELAIIRYKPSNLKESLDLINEGLAMDPDYVPLLAVKGMIYFSARDLSHALGQFERSIMIDPNSEMGWYGRALVMESLRNTSLAVQSYQRLLNTSMRIMSREEIEKKLAELSK